MHTTLYAGFADKDQAVKAAGALLDFGMDSSDVSLVSAGTETDLERYREASTFRFTQVEQARHDEAVAKDGVTVTTVADAKAAALPGAEVGLGVGLVVGLAALIVPGFGLVLGGGALAMALAGAAGTTAAGALAGAATGYMKDQGVPAETVAAYHEVVGQGGAILAVALPSNGVDESKARGLLAKYGSQNVTTH
ncbi:MAG: hypothetical protein HZB16_10495 [Armatimonadetes bacterium]|nr:hypothetical protein [Armatimonadota bacterium]